MKKAGYHLKNGRFANDYLSRYNHSLNETMANNQLSARRHKRATPAETSSGIS